MNEILLQTIVEKLESLEIALLKDSDVSKDESFQKATLQSLNFLQYEFKTFTSRSIDNTEKLNDISKEINILKLSVGSSSSSYIKHIHHFHKLVWATVSLFTILILFGYGWINCHNEKKAFEANDIKYRYWKVDSNASLLKLTNFTDSLYDLDKEGFMKHVVRVEQQYYQLRK